MSEISLQNDIQFIIGTGDNFYNPDGVSSIQDDAWDSHWRLIY